MKKTIKDYIDEYKKLLKWEKENGPYCKFIEVVEDGKGHWVTKDLYKNEKEEN